MFKVETVLRSSGMTLEKTLSIKEEHAVLQVQRADTGSFILRLYRREIPAYRMLEGSWCAGFPAVYRTYEEEGFFVVEEELVEGISLQDCLAEKGAMCERQAVETALQICDALKILHQNGLIHRDIKPEHVLLTQDNRVCLIDLDASMGIQREKLQDTQLIGTIAYAAPEQFGLTRSDVRTDLYAMGILLNEMMTGVHPTVKQYRKGRIGAAIETCTRLNPDARCQTAEELMEILGDPAKYAASAPAAVRQNRFIKMAAAAMAAAAVFLGAGWIGWMEKDSAALDDISDTLPASLNKEARDAVRNVSPPVKIEGASPAMEDQWLQMYKYDWMEDYAQVHRDGGQAVRYYTEDGTLIDNTYHVYCDPQVGRVRLWDSETGAWDIVSQNCDAGATGYIYAEKDGKTYAIDVLVLGESMSAYTSLPTLVDFTQGYLQSRQVNGQGDTYGIDRTYRREEKVTLYLAAAMGMEMMEVACSSSLVSIEPVEPYGLWNGPVYKLTFSNPEGGDTWFTVKSNMNSLTFFMKEELPAGQ